MPLLVSTLEDRLRLCIGDLVLQKESLAVQLDAALQRIAELEAEKKPEKKSG